MKKILINILIIVFGLSISACNKDIDTGEKDIIDDKFEVLEKVYSNDGLYEPYKENILDVYIAKKNDYDKYYIGEMKIVDKKLIAGYIDKKSEYKVTRMYDIVTNNTSISNYDNKIYEDGSVQIFMMAEYLFQKGIYDFFDFNNYLYECSNNIPLVREDKIFVFAIEYYKVEFYEGNYITYINILRGKQVKDKYVLDGDRESLTLGKYIKKYEYAKYNPVRVLKNYDVFIPVENYKGIEIIKIDSNDFLYRTNNELKGRKEFFEFFNLIKEAIISEEKEIKENTIYYVEYNKIKDLLFKI